MIILHEACVHAETREYIRSESFREKATLELLRVAELIVPSLERARAAGPTLEAGRRLDLILKEAADRQSPEPSTAELGTVRAVEALELMNTPEAQALLRRLAQGAEGSRLTREARASLKRSTEAIRRK